MVEQLLHQTNFSSQLKHNDNTTSAKIQVFLGKAIRCVTRSINHLEIFKAHMMLHSYVEEIACQALSLTLKEIARSWFGTL